MNIESVEDLHNYLRDSNRIASDESVVVQPLSGGVSNRTVLITRHDGTSWVMKQALEKLRVDVDWYSDPRRVEREALGMSWLSQIAPPRSIPKLLFVDPDHCLLAMEAIPFPHATWKSHLMKGNIHKDHLRQFGHLIGSIHRRSSHWSAEDRMRFDDRQYFESLRLEPYYAYTRQTVPSAARFLDALIDETRATRLSIVHGDYSPKNILVYQDRLILIDHEVIHFGDPAFDLGFGLTHLLSKAHYRAEFRTNFCAAAIQVWEAYQQAIEEVDWAANLESRVIRHTIACLLARARGRSPLEYLNASARQRQEAYALRLVSSQPTMIAELVNRWKSFCDEERIEIR